MDESIIASGTGRDVISIAKEGIEKYKEALIAMRIRNFTPHPICFYHESDVNFVSKLRKYYAKPDAKPYLVIESEGMLSIEFENERVTHLDFPVPVYYKIVSRVDRLPATEKDDIVVVSAMYAAYRKISDIAHIPLFCIKDTVYNENGAPIGCLGLCKQ